MKIFVDILFLCVFGMLVIGMIHIKTNEQSISICKSFVMNIWTVICIGAVWAFVMNFFHIPIMLSTMTGAYSISALVVWGYIFTGKKKRNQSLIFVWNDFFSVVFCVAVWAIVFLKVFGLELSISYNGVDAGTHYRLACEIFYSHKLNRMYFAPLYNSLIMELLEPFLIRETMYKAFILADALWNLLNILMFYVLASDFAKSKFSKVAIDFVILFYFLGWPVWSWIAGGFVYYGIGVTIYLYGIYLLNQFDKSYNKSARIYYGILILMTLFGITECYLLFSPVYIVTVFVYFLYYMRDRISKYMLLKVLLVTIIVGGVVFGLIFWGFFHGNVASIFRSLRLEGGIHRELYKDFMFIVPINLFLCVLKYKEKKLDLLAITVLAQLFITTLALFVNLCGFISDYYYFKLYYLGWALQLAGVVQAIDYFWREHKQVIYFCIIPIVLAAILEITGLSQAIIMSVSGNTELFPVITQSVGYIRYLHDANKERKENMITAYKWINDNLQDEMVPLVTTFDDVQVSWYLAITGGKSYYVDQKEAKVQDNLNNILIKLKESKYQYFTMMQDIEEFSECTEWFNQFEKVYDDGCYGVYMIEK
ncbi:MAG: hypothetical protein HFJ07_00115 [Lachnospiraceae bacterium]|nr:hypothetical protein [Lachnospiraceae bacterium]